MARKDGPSGCRRAAVPSTIRAVDRTAPDLLFLDIEMPGASGLEVVARLTHQPHVIFTTAHSHYAVTAFELQAVDYLLKPFGPERLAQALDRVRTLEGASYGSRERARAALEGRGPIDRLFVRERGRIIPINTTDIVRLQAEDDYVMVHTAQRRHLVSIRLKDFEARLDSQRFLRVHRSHIVNLDFVDAFEPHDDTRLMIRLTDGTGIVASRMRSRGLRRFVL